jgi:hypothetical protein
VLSFLTCGEKERPSSILLDLFGEVARVERARVVYEAIDNLDAKYGKHTVFLGSSYGALNGVQHQDKRGEHPRRRGMLLKGEGERKRLGYRYWARYGEVTERVMASTYCRG